MPKGNSSVLIILHIKWLILRAASDFPKAYIMSSFADLCFTTYLHTASCYRECGIAVVTMKNNTIPHTQTSYECWTDRYQFAIPINFGKTNFLFKFSLLIQISVGIWKGIKQNNETECIFVLPVQIDFIVEVSTASTFIVMMSEEWGAVTLCWLHDWRMFRTKGEK